MKRKWISLAFALLFLFTAQPTTFSAVAGGEGEGAETEESVSADTGFEAGERDIDTGYLLRENFLSFANGGSGWERVNIPVSNTPAVITNRSKAVEAYLRKKFVPQTGKFVVEFKVIPIVEITGGSFRVQGAKGGAEVDAIRIDVENNALSVTDSTGGKTSFGEIRFGTWNGIKLVVDTAAQSYDLFLNGACTEETRGLKFSAAADELGRVYFGIDREATGTFKLGTVYVYKGYDVYEDLISAGTGSLYDPEYDYAKLASPRVTAEEHRVPNNNTNLAHLAFDDDPATYWEHNTAYPANYVSFMAEFKGNVVPIDSVRLVFAAEFKGILNIAVQDASGAWGQWGGSKYHWYPVLADESNDYTVELTLDAPVFLTTFAVNFRRGSGELSDYNIPDDIIKLATFEAKCSVDLVGRMPDMPSDWTADTAAGSVTAHPFYGASEIDEYNVFKLENSTGSGRVSLEKEFSRSGDLSAEFMMLYNDRAEDNLIGLETASGDFAGFMTGGEGNSLKLVQIVDGQVKEVTPIVSRENRFDEIKTMMWYRALLRADGAANTLSVDLNGWSPIQPVALDPAFSGCTWTKFVARSSGSNTTFYVDNIRIYPTPAPSEVPEPEVCDTGDTILTMQACTLWREGTHVGWKALDREEMYHRKPVLGWYDEGSAEVADWEIKFALDHGINNFMYCWYRKDTGSGPIQSSGYADELWEGIFRSKYRDQIGFSLMYTNNDPLPNSYSYADFRDNLVPYWIETFFKNPNYTKTADGKPIFYIYEPIHFIDQVGDLDGDGTNTAADARLALGDMRRQCVEAGLGGLYLATEYRGSQASQIVTIENCGYDAVFAYTWTSGSFNMTDDEVLAYAQDSMLKQRAAVQNPESFQVIPNISKSWDPRGWTGIGFGGGNSPVYMYDLEHYREMAVWAKDVFGGATVDSKGNKLIMLDNWNEFSEGHWLMPTYGTPAYKGGRETFGYLDVLREVFGTGPYEHKDYLPLEDGFGPYDTWYPPAWDQANDPYKPIFGSPQDDSVFDPEIRDHTIGVDTTGGTTLYHAEGTKSGGLYLIEASEAVRVTLAQERVAELKDGQLGLEIRMKNGVFSMTAAEVGALADRDLDIILNRKLNVSEAAAKLRDAGAGRYDLLDGLVYSLEIRQDGFPAAAAGTVEISCETSRAAGLSILTDTAGEPSAGIDGVFRASVRGGCDLAVIFEY